MTWAQPLASPWFASLAGALAALLLFVGAASAREVPGGPQVLLVPENGVPARVVNALATAVAERTGLAVKPLLAMGLAEAEVNGRGQLKVEPLLALLQPPADRFRRLYNARGALVVLVTIRDINNSDGSTNFLFAFHNFDANLSIVSMARLSAASEALILARAAKLVMRAVGEQVMGLPRSADPASVMYSPLLNVDDLDMIGETLGPGI